MAGPCRFAQSIPIAASDESQILRVSEDRESSLARLAAAIHVGVFNLAPLMCIASRFDDVAVIIETRAAEIARDIERVRQPVDLYREYDTKNLRASALFLQG